MKSNQSAAGRLFIFTSLALAVGLLPLNDIFTNIISGSGHAGDAVLYAQDSGSDPASQASDALPGDADAPSKPKVDPADKMFCEAHMKLARRHFKLGNIDRAQEELDLVIERLGSHTEARFMRAVLAAKTKDFMSAWRHISIAEQSAPDHPRIKEFITRLEKAMPRPSVIPEEVTARPAPTHASELLGDAIESLFANKAASGKITTLGCEELAEKDGKTVAKLVFEGNSPLDETPIKDTLKGALKGEIRNAQTASGGTTLEISIEIPDLPLLNTSAKPVSSLGELLKAASEETDVAIKNSSESEPDADRRMTGTYTIIAAGLRNVNDFMRKLSSEAVDCRILHLANTTVNEQNVWKGDVSFRFLAP